MPYTTCLPRKFVLRPFIQAVILQNIAEFIKYIYFPVLPSQTSDPVDLQHGLQISIGIHLSTIIHLSFYHLSGDRVRDKRKIPGNNSRLRCQLCVLTHKGNGPPGMDASRYPYFFKGYWGSCGDSKIQGAWGEWPDLIKIQSLCEVRQSFFLNECKSQIPGENYHFFMGTKKQAKMISL